MRKVSVSSTLTVYHDDQFWVGIFEHIEEGRLSAARVVFGAEPSNEQILELIAKRWNKLRFMKTSVEADTSRQAGNPKRRIREAAKSLRQQGISTKAQQALSENRERLKAESKASRPERRRKETERHFKLKSEKRKKKHRGR